MKLPEKLTAFSAADFTQIPWDRVAATFATQLEQAAKTKNGAMVNPAPSPSEEQTILLLKSVPPDVVSHHVHVSVGGWWKDANGVYVESYIQWVTPVLSLFQLAALIIVAATGCLAIPCLGQETVPLAPKPLQVTTELVKLDLSVIDEHGQFAAGLRPANLRVPGQRSPANDFDLRFGGCPSGHSGTGRNGPGGLSARERTSCCSLRASQRLSARRPGRAGR